MTQIKTVVLGWNFGLISRVFCVLITASLSSKTYNRALESEFFALDGNVVNVDWNDVGVLALDGFVHGWLCGLQRVSP